MDKLNIKKILIVSLTNIGDVIMTFPVIDIIRRDFSNTYLSLVIGPKAAPLFEGNKSINKIYIYNKKQPIKKTLKWLFELRKQKFDLVVDLRNSAIPFILGSRYKTFPFIKRQPKKHMRWQHINRLRTIYPFHEESAPTGILDVGDSDKKFVQKIISQENQGKAFIIIAPGAADHTKRWTLEGFSALSDYFIKCYQVNVVMVGDHNDVSFVEGICQKMKYRAINLCGKMSLIQLSYLMPNSLLAIVNDSAPMHLASYCHIPIIALFGPTDPQRYGPWSDQSCVVKKEGFCKACAGGIGLPHECMQAIKVEDVLDTFHVNMEEKIFRK